MPISWGGVHFAWRECLWRGWVGVGEGGGRGTLSDTSGSFNCVRVGLLRRLAAQSLFVFFFNSFCALISYGITERWQLITFVPSRSAWDCQRGNYHCRGTHSWLRAYKSFGYIIFIRAFHVCIFPLPFPSSELFSFRYCGQFLKLCFCFVSF